MKLKLPYYEAVRDGKKTVEGRPGDGSFAKLAVGDTIQFSLDGDAHAPIINVKIVDILRFDSFEAMIRAVGREACLPGMTTSDEEALAVYHSFPNYPDRAQNFGVLAIFIQLV